MAATRAASYVLATICVAGAAALAADPLPPRLYELTVETGMPHLEENLRYAVTHSRRCMRREELASVFPILSHPALEGCSLQHELEREDTISYTLVCAGGHGTSGSATWRLGSHDLRGTLAVKLGGKNMTFYQRVIASPVGRCAS